MTQRLVALGLAAAVTFSLLLGIGLLMVERHKRDTTTKVIDTLADACLRVVVLIMKLAPLAVFVLSAILVANLGLGVVRAMAVFVVATAGGLALILFVQYPLVMSTRALAGSFPGLIGLPTTYVVDQQGRIVKKHVGQLRMDRVEAEVRALLDAAGR